MSEKLVEIKDLEISFGEGSKKFVAVKNANFFINKGETFSLVGESGSGKTTIGRAIIGLNNTSKGEIIFDGHKINGKKSHKESSELIRRIQMIFQDPAASLNERATVDYIISEGLYNYHLFKDEEERKEKVQKMGPKSLKSCVCLNKPSRREVDVEPDYVAFTIEDVFIVGYGLNYGDYMRNVPYIFTYENK